MKDDTPQDVTTEVEATPVIVLHEGASKKKVEDAPVQRITLPYRKTRKWHDQTLYECNACAYSTTNESAMLMHIDECKRTGGI